jgi:hypothetical protein
MLKLLAVCANVLALLIVSLMTQNEGIKIEITVPEKGVPGQEVTMQIRINKGSLTGNGLLEVRVDEGMGIMDSIGAGSEFVFSNGVGNWKWSELPGSEEILITAKLFLDEKERIQHLSATFTQQNEEGKTSVGPVEMSVDVAIPSGTHAEPVTPVSAGRKVEWRSGEAFVWIEIRKDGTRGFARYSDALPAVWNVRAVQTEGASFSVSEGRIRFVWVDVPDRDTVRIAYAVKAPEGETLALMGEYTYIEKNRSMTITLPPDSLRIPVTAMTDEQRTPVTKPETNPGVTYHVQIGAFKNPKVTASRLKSKYRLSAPVRSDMHNGLHKFFTGNHSEYTMARGVREKLRAEHGVSDPFVVAYHRGKRITVQEALSITRQKWHQ